MSQINDISSTNRGSAAFGSIETKSASTIPVVTALLADSVETSQTSTSVRSSAGLSLGTIIGIGLGVILGFFLTGGIAYALILRRRQKRLRATPAWQVLEDSELQQTPSKNRSSSQFEGLLRFNRVFQGAPSQATLPEPFI
ncbi:hypothetical protein D9756_006151 [Leucocoprinus leucothites]|uniref:Uncharacterized protein n=1 Tax=Leucocoprinus leucothites TaxID=201217 RepID=A0A8H5FXH1_9AGAR|nr:hypothetical protein D9756_006151 [Leucoagaricus leucothites]